MNRRDLERAAKKYGATVESDPRNWPEVTYQIVLPPGKRWFDDLHCLKVDYDRTDPAWRDAAIADAIERMEQYGQPEDCDCNECSYHLHCL